MSHKTGDLVLTALGGAVGALEGAVVALAVVVAAVARVDCEQVSIQRADDRQAQLTRVVSEQSRSGRLTEKDGEGGDNGDGELVHVVDEREEKRDCLVVGGVGEANG